MAALAAASVYNVPEDGNEEQCGACGLPGSLLCCEACPAAYHAGCAGYGVHALPSMSIAQLYIMQTTLMCAELLGAARNKPGCL